MSRDQRKKHEQDDKQKKAHALESLLMDTLHTMQSMDQAENLGMTPLPAEETSAKKSGPDESLLDRLSELTGSALKLAVRTTDASVRVGRALIRSQDQLRAMVAAGDSLRDIREVAGLTLADMSEALNLRDKGLLEAVENGTSTLSFELILRLAALLARNDPIPFILRYSRNYSPETWKLLNDWGAGRLALQFERERQFINIFRGHDEARELSDEGFNQVLEFTRRSFEMSLHFVAEQEKKVSAIEARYQPGAQDDNAQPETT